MNCIICDLEEFDVLFSAGKAQEHEILKCKNCALMYINNKSGFSEIQGLKSSPKGVTITRQYIEKQNVQMPDYIKIANELVSRYGNKGSLLEIGTNIGVLLNYLNQIGFHTVGIEPNKWCVNYARDNFNLNIYPTDLIGAKFESEKFDIVVMLHVIEHLPDPNREIKEIHRILKTGGCLVLETPSYDALPFKILRHRERSLRCRGHLYFFTPKTLKLLVAKNGFDVVKLEYVGRTLTLDRLIYNIGVILGNKKLNIFLQNISEKLGLSKIKIKLNVKDMQRMYVVKTKQTV